MRTVLNRKQQHHHYRRSYPRASLFLFRLSSTMAALSVSGHSTAAAAHTPNAAPATPAKPRRQAEDLRTLTAALGGWETNLDDLESLEQDIEYVMDEDQKRTLDARSRS